MKRYLCTVAVGMLLALAGAATASAGDLPVLGQTGTQLTGFGDQTVGEQQNDADVTQEQGNDNLAITPALGLGGDAETTNAQGNGNEAEAEVEQENDVDQSQSSTQVQSLDSGGSNGCCDRQSQTGQQTTYGGDQTVEKQKNDADVTQEQGNGNIAIAPAIAVFGDAETTNKQGNGNTAKADVEQENDVDQSQSSTQKQEISGDGGSCCGSNGYGKGKHGCCNGQSQTGEQKTSFGDQTVGEQTNYADVTQEQGNGNIAFSPAFAIFGDAESTNYQGNGNTAKAEVEQENDVDQSQDSTQKQSLESSGSDDGHCCGGSSQTGEQKTYFGDQTVEKQKNDADVTQKQGNGNVWIGPAIAIGGDAETTNYQGNGNKAKAEVEQENDVDQSQSSTQKQEISGDGGSCCESKGHGKHGYGKEECCHGPSQTGEQKTSFGDQSVGEQVNDADVTQKQGNDNVAFAPALSFGGGKKGDSCNSMCGKSGYGSYGGHRGSGAETTNYQGNGNEAKAEVEQKNDVDQSQTSYQRQSLVEACKELVA